MPDCDLLNAAAGRSPLRQLLNFGRTRTNVGVDLYNALNVNTATNYNSTFGPAWLRPTSVLPARSAKISAQIDW